MILYYLEKKQEVLVFNHFKSYTNIFSYLNKRIFILYVFFAKCSSAWEIILVIAKAW